MKVWLTPQQVADQLQLKVQTVYQLIKLGKLPAIRIQRVYRIDPDELKQFLASRKTDVLVG